MSKQIIKVIPGMGTHVITSTLGYALINGFAIAIGYHLWGYFSTPTYQIVTLFITLIIVSNCLAKLFMIYIDYLR